MKTRKQYGLTPQQLRLLNHINDYIKRHGFSPSYREMADMMGLRSTSNVHRLVRGLKDRGHIDLMPACARALRVVSASEGASDD